jgi:hypothetical protein
MPAGDSFPPSAHVVPILLFDPRCEHSSAPTAILAAVARRACQGWPRLSRPPEGLGLDGNEHDGTFERIGLGGFRLVK